MADNATYMGLPAQNDLLVRDVSPLFQIVAAGVSPLVAAFLERGKDRSMFNPAFSPKHEWINAVLTPYKYSVTAVNSWVPTIDNTTGAVNNAVVWTILEVVTSAGVYTGKQAVLTAIVDTSGVKTFTLSQYGTASFSVSATDSLVEVSRPRPENSQAENGKYELGTTEYNQTEIFAETIGISGSAQASNVYGRYNTEEMQLRQILTRQAQRMTKAIFRGQRVDRVPWDTTKNGTMGGLSYFLAASGGNIVANGSPAVLTNAMINSILYGILERGGTIEGLKIVANGRHSAALAAASQANGWVTAMTITNGDGVNFGFGSNKFTSSMGTQHEIIYDPSADISTIQILNFDDTGLVPLGNREFGIWDATQPGQDGIARRVLWEYTLEIHNAKQKHGIITGLTV